MTDDPRFPPIHITKIVEEDGRTFSMPVTSPICDFCGDGWPSWDYDCHDFVARLPDLASMGGWAACDACSELIEADDWDAVLERSLILGRKLGREEETRVDATLMHKGFREHRYGERRPWG